MSIRLRAVVGAVALFGGLLFVIGGSIYKSSDRIRYDRAVEHHKHNPEPPQTAGGNFFMILGSLSAAAGAVVVAFALRDMVRQIGEAQSRAETALRMEGAAKRDPMPPPRNS